VDVTLKRRLFRIIWQSFTAIGRGSLKISGLNIKSNCPKIVFLAGGPKFWGRRCLNGDVSNHVPKFHGDQSRELGDITLQTARKKNFRSET